MSFAGNNDKEVGVKERLPGLLVEDLAVMIIIEVLPA